MITKEELNLRSQLKEKLENLVLTIECEPFVKGGIANMLAATGEVQDVLNQLKNIVHE